MSPGFWSRCGVSGIDSSRCETLLSLTVYGSLTAL
jgi:hypothetical protein